MLICVGVGGRGMSVTMSYRKNGGALDFVGFWTGKKTNKKVVDNSILGQPSVISPS